MQDAAFAEHQSFQGPKSCPSFLFDFSPTALAMGSLPISVPGRCRGGFRTTGSGKVPGKVPNHGFRKVPGQVPGLLG